MSRALHVVFRLILTTFAILALPVGVSAATLQYSNDFDPNMGVYGTDYAIGWYGSFTNTPFGSPTGCELTKTFVVVDDPDEAGNKVLRIREDRDTCITNEDDSGNNNVLRLQKHRAQWKPEANGAYFMPKDTEIWMGFRWRFNGSPNPPQIDPYVLQARMFATAGGSGDQGYETPDIRVLDNGTNLGVRRAYLDSAGKQQYGAWTKIPIVPNKWMNIVMQLRLTSTSPDGYFRLWLNAASANDTPLIDEKNTWTGSYLDDVLLGGAYKYDYKTHHSIGWYWGDTSTPNDHIMLMDDLKYAFGVNGFDMVNPQGGGGTPDTTAPTTPTSLTGTPTSTTQINLAWNASTDNVGVATYRLERCTGATCTTFTQVATPTGTTYANTALTANTTYRFRVRAMDAAGNTSAYSSIVNATTQGATSAPTVTLSANPTTITQGQSSTLSWSSTNATSCTASNGWSGTKATSGTQTLSPTTNTTYTISCTGAGGSIVKSVTVAVATTGGGATLGWQLDFNNGFQTIVPSESVLTSVDGGTSKIDQLCTGGRKWSLADPMGGSNKALRVFQGGDGSCLTGVSTNPKHRAMFHPTSLGSHYDYEINEDHWLGYKIWFPDDFPSGWLNGENETREKLEVAHWSFQGESKIRITADQNGPVYGVDRGYSTAAEQDIYVDRKDIPMPTGRWVNVVYHVLRKTNDTGMIEVWIDGVKKVTMNGRTASDFDAVGQNPNGNNSAPWKIGLYWGDLNRPDFSIYLDDMKYAKGADGYALVDPSQGGGGTADTTAPTTPTNLSATPTSTTQINLSWTASTDAVGVTGYRIYRNGTQLTTTTGTTYSSIGLTQATTYTYTVQAYDAAGNLSTYSNIISATTQSAEQPSTKFTPGDRVKTLNILNVRTAPANNAPGTKTGTQALGAEGTVIGGPLASLSTTGATVWWWQIDYIAAPDGWGSEQYLEKVIAQYPTPTLTLSASPTSLTSGQSTTLTWSSTNATSCTASNGWTGTKATSGTQTLSPTANTTYTLTCTGAGGTTTQSATVTVTAATDTTAPTTPTNPFAGAISTSQINLSWSVSTDNVSVTGYRLERCTGATCTTFAQIAAPSIIIYSDTNLTAGTTYRYRVRATDAAGNLSTYSSIVSATTQSIVTPTPTLTLSASPLSVTTGNSTTLTWSGTNATTCTASGAWFGTTTTSGSQTIVPAASTTYTLTCTGAGGSIAKSVSVSVTAATDTTAPRIVSATVSNTTATGATITLTASEPVTATISYGTSSNSLTTTATSNTAGTTHVFDLTNLTRKTAYFYQLSLRDAAGNTTTGPVSSLTTSARSIKPPKVQNVTATEGSVILTWTNPTYEYTRDIRIYRKTNNGTVIDTPDSAYLIATLPTGTTTYTDTAVAPNTRYVYTIFTYDDQSAYSEPASLVFTTSVDTVVTTPDPETPALEAPSTVVTTTGGSTTTSAAPSTTAAIPAIPATPTTPTTSTPPTTHYQPLTRALTLGSRGDDVTTLQQMLAQDPTIYQGEITGYYGPLTQAAVERFQIQHAIVSSGSPSTTGYGAVGPSTRAQLNTLYAGTTTTPPTASGLTPEKRALILEQIRLLQEQVKLLLQQLTLLLQRGVV